MPVCLGISPIGWSNDDLRGWASLSRQTAAGREAGRLGHKFRGIRHYCGHSSHIAGSV
jgi:hypothetical protein